tara:strand:+ start:1418 stop:1684 length:267 start_codon:yes stop_codon:yes gene_type:complete
MKFDSRTVNTSGQILNEPWRVKSIEFHARSGNTESVVVGISTVASDNGREVPPGESVIFNFDDGSEEMNVFYASIPSGCKLDWAAILR